MYKVLTLIIAILICLYGSHTHMAQAAVVESVAPEVSRDKLLALQPDDFFLGRKDAKIVIIEYSSTSCPHCAEFHHKTFEQLREKYINTGKVLYIYRDYPTNRPGLLGAMLAHCAGNMEYLSYINTLMTSQPLWAYKKDYEALLTNIGRLGGIPEEKITACFSNGALENKILNRAMVAGKSLGITATPTFFIDGRKHTGILTNTELFRLLDGLLAN